MSLGTQAIPSQGAKELNLVPPTFCDRGHRAASGLRRRGRRGRRRADDGENGT